MKTFKTLYVNPTRRDLIKQLVGLGALAATAGLSSSLARAGKAPSAKGVLSSALVERGDKDYALTHRDMVWRLNTPERYPDIIVQVESEDEVIAALQFAGANDLQVTSRGSGHNTAASVLRNGGMLLDVSALNQIQVDAENKTVTVQAGAKMHALIAHLSLDDLAFPVAGCHTVALGGYLLGGGHGPNGRHWGHGPACFSILSVDVILASGEKVTASASENTDLYWAVRGAGPGFFGVVTRFTLQAYKKQGLIAVDSYMFDMDKLPQLFEMLEELQPQKDSRVETEFTFAPHPKRKDDVVVYLGLRAYADSGKEPEQHIKQLLAPYTENAMINLALAKKERRAKELIDFMFTPPQRARADSDNIFTNSTDSFLALADLYKKAPANSGAFMSFSHDSHNYQARDTACYSAAGIHSIHARLKWKNAQDDEENIHWFSEFNRILLPYITGTYISEADIENNPARIEQSFSRENWQKLQAIRAHYDPATRFYSYL